ncbi:uncharacterized protein LOC133713726 isoform X2 [Rosa rugosa]|uniref:uncharacterized protein LOC133713726 isoform X2 n=1 Tax=Rosa rugosa TaxID=74645 RepID=UPI002B41466B|nr:uncharacterized protein LOC133713726 isoform X2 [Rosa rugosa]
MANRGWTTSRFPDQRLINSRFPAKTQDLQVRASLWMLNTSICIDLKWISGSLCFLSYSLISLMGKRRNSLFWEIERFGLSLRLWSSMSNPLCIWHNEFYY